jgi:hypothetical protein
MMMSQDNPFRLSQIMLVQGFIQLALRYSLVVTGIGQNTLLLIADYITIR